MSLKIVEIGISYTTSGSELTELDNLLSQGYRVVDCSVYTYDSEVTQRWTLHLPSPSVEEEDNTGVKYDILFNSVSFFDYEPVLKSSAIARLTIALKDLPHLDNLPIKYDLIWRTDTSARIEVLSIGDNNTPASFVCEMCGDDCNGSVRNGHLYCQECLTELDEPYE